MKKKMYGGKKMKAGGKKKMGMGGSYMEESKELKFGGPKYRAGTSPRPDTSDGKAKQPVNSATPVTMKKGESFSQAFAKARKAQGPGGTFMYKGKKYTTDRADDKKKPVSNTKKIASKSAGQLKTGVKKPGLQASKPAAPAAPKSKKAAREDKRMDRKSNRMNRKGMSKGDKLRARADKSDAKMVDRRKRKQDRKDKRRPNIAKGRDMDQSKLEKGLAKTRGMRAGGMKEPSADQKGLKKLPTAVRNKMGYKRAGGKKKAMFGMLGKIKGAVDGAKGGGGLMGAAKGALGGGLAGRAVGAVKGAMGGGGLQGAIQGFKGGAFGDRKVAAGGEQEQSAFQRSIYGDRKKMTAGGMGRAGRLASKAKSAQMKAKRMAPGVNNSGVGGKKDVALEKQRAKANKLKQKSKRASRGKV